MSCDSYLLCSVSDTLCAAPMEDVLHISRVVALEPHDDLPSKIIGLCHYLDQPVFGLDLASELGHAGHIYDERARMLILERRGIRFGALVDTIGEIVTFDGDVGKTSVQLPVSRNSCCVSELFRHQDRLAHVIDPILLFDRTDRVKLRVLSQKQVTSLIERIS
jgi:chemotaxis signal transduction protein